MINREQFYAKIAALQVALDATNEVIRRAETDARAAVAKDAAGLISMADDVVQALRGIDAPFDRVFNEYTSLLRECEAADAEDELWRPAMERVGIVFANMQARVVVSRALLAQLALIQPAELTADRAKHIGAGLRQWVDAVRRGKWENVE
jgi:hypothetical protein